MNKLRNGKWNHQVATAEEVKEALKEINDIVNKYQWENKRFLDPYGHGTTVGDFLSQDGFKNFEQYNFSSRQILISELNGFIEHCLNPWVKFENEPKMTVELSNGTIKTIAQSLAQAYIECGLATTVK